MKNKKAIGKWTWILILFILIVIVLFGIYFFMTVGGNHDLNSAFNSASGAIPSPPPLPD